MGHRHWGYAVLGLTAGLMLMTTEAAQAGRFMATGGRTTQPIGHYDFCKQMAAECSQKSRSTARLPMTRELMRKLASVNVKANAKILPRTDMQIWGREEVWSYPVMRDGVLVGDCEDYVMTKRRMLMDAGIEPANLLITVVLQPNGDGHAVLTVRTTGGDYILDNLNNRVLHWQRTPYTYLKRQSERHSGVWLSVNDGRADAVAGIR